MSTRSELYHCFGLGVVEVLKVDHSGGRTVFHARHARDRISCSACHGSDVTLRGTIIRDFRLPSIGCRETVVRFCIQRVECPVCGVVRQEHLPFAEHYKRHTRSFARYVVELSRIGTVKDVAQHLGVSWDLVREIQQQHLERSLATINLRKLRYVGIDEFAVGKGHRYVTVVLDMERGAVVHVAEGKGTDSVKPFLKKMKRCGAEVEAFVTDMGRAFPAAVMEVFKGVDLVYDRFHVVKLMNEKLTDLRRDMQREAAELLEKDTLKGTRWLLLKNPQNLNTDKGEWEKLQEALTLNAPLAMAYYMKEDLRRFWDFPNANQAEKHLDVWIRRAERSGIAVLKTMARTLQGNKRGLLNWYKHPISNGPLEGFNNKAQTMKRQAYGYRNMDFFKLKLMTLHNKKYALTG
jgi:transposase